MPNNTCQALFQTILHCGTTIACARAARSRSQAQAQAPVAASATRCRLAHALRGDRWRGEAQNACYEATSAPFCLNTTSLRCDIPPRAQAAKRRRAQILQRARVALRLAQGALRDKGKRLAPRLTCRACLSRSSKRSTLRLLTWRYCPTTWL